MGTPVWPDRTRHTTKRAHKFREHEAPIAQEESRWQCKTCTGVIASNDDIYCLSCKMYWRDVKNGLFDDACDCGYQQSRCQWPDCEKGL